MPTFVPRRTAIALAALCLVQNAALAQSSEGAVASEPPVSGNAPEQIIVKARGRAEVLQNVPASVKAFSAQAINDAGINRPADFIALTPNVSFVESQSAGNSFITVRGLTQVRNGDSPVAVVVDGVTQTSPQQFNQDLFDIRSIEVLRGPQGALYGRNASGGAILIETKAPSNKSEGYARVGVGNGGYRSLQLGTSGAFVEDTLYYRLVGSESHSDGFFKNLVLGESVDQSKSRSLRGNLRWDASEDLRIDLRASYVDDHGGALNYVYQPTHVNADCTADANNLFDETRIDANRVTRTFCANNLGKNWRRMSDLVVKAEYNLLFATLGATYAHNVMKEYIQGDGYPYTASPTLDFFGVPAEGTQTQYVDSKSDSVELRLTSSNKFGLRWMAGVYALRTDRYISSGNGDDLGQGIVSLYRDPAFGSTINPTNFWLADSNRNLATAAFGNVDWDISRQLEASFALRYDRDHREDKVDPRNSAGLPTGCSEANSAACAKTATFSATQPKFSLKYRVDSDSVVYGSYGVGFRSGLFNQSGTAAIAAAAVPPISGVTDLVDAETTKSGELGYKQSFLDGRLRLDVAVFDTRVENSPYFAFVPSVGSQIMIGINEVQLRGGEVELIARLAPGLDGSAGIGVTKSTIKQFDAMPDAVGNWAPYVPKFGANGGLQYRFPLSGNLKALVRGDLVYKGKQFWDAENSSARDSLTLVNLRAGLEDSKGIWSVALSVNNATNKSYNAEWVSGGFAQPATPRTTRVEGRYNF